MSLKVEIISAEEETKDCKRLLVVKKRLKLSLQQ